MKLRRWLKWEPLEPKWSSLTFFRVKYYNWLGSVCLNFQHFWEVESLCLDFCWDWWDKPVCLQSTCLRALYKGESKDHHIHSLSICFHNLYLQQCSICSARYYQQILYRYYIGIFTIMNINHITYRSWGLPEPGFTVGNNLFISMKEP